MSEQFAFQQFCRDSTAIDWNERPLAPLGMVVQVTRDHLLAGTGFAEDQHAGLRISDLLHHLTDMLHRSACAN